MFYLSYFLSAFLGYALRVCSDWERVSKKEVVLNFCISMSVCYFAYIIKIDYAKKLDFISMQLWLGLCSYFATYMLMTLDSVFKTGFRNYLRNALKKFIGNDN